MNGKDFKTFEVKNTPSQPQNYELFVFIDKNELSKKDGSSFVTKTLEAKFINDFYDLRIKDPEKRDRNLFVNSFEIEGPIGKKLDDPPAFHKEIFGDIQITEENKIRMQRKFYGNSLTDPTEEKFLNLRLIVC